MRLFLTTPYLLYLYQQPFKSQPYHVKAVEEQRSEKQASTKVIARGTAILLGTRITLDLPPNLLSYQSGPVRSSLHPYLHLCMSRKDFFTIGRIGRASHDV